LVAKFPGRKVETHVIKGKALEEAGMKLFYEVGKGATSEPRCVVVRLNGAEGD
jgi:leucyl aminopeptidase